MANIMSAAMLLGSSRTLVGRQQLNVDDRPMATAGVPSEKYACNALLPAVFGPCLLRCAVDGRLRAPSFSSAAAPRASGVGVAIATSVYHTSPRPPDLIRI